MVMEITSAACYPVNQELHLYEGQDNVFHVKHVASTDTRRHITQLFSEEKTDLSVYEAE